jgi:hypothetical protein
MKSGLQLVFDFPPRSNQRADCLIFAAQLKRREQIHGTRCGHTLQVNWYNGRALPGGCYRCTLSRRSFQKLKSTPQSEDKINDCGNLSHNIANDFQWSINTSMAFFSEKRKGVEAKF